MARWATAWQNVGFARQSALNTENTTDGDFHYFPAEVSIPETTRQMFDLKVGTGQVGAKYRPTAGAKRGKFSIKMPMYGLKVGYDPTTEEPGITTGVCGAAQVLTGLALGSASEAAGITNAATFAKGQGLSLADLTAAFTATYANNEIASVGSTTTATVQAGDGSKFKVGQLFACGSDAADTAQTLAWIKSISTDELTFIDAAGNQPQANDDVWGTWVAFVSSQTVQPLTFRIMGDNAAFKDVFYGCYPTSWKFSGKSGEPPQIEIMFESVGVTRYGTGGGLQPLSQTPKLPGPVLGVGAGRFTFGTGTGAMSALCGIRDFEISVANKIAMVPCHSQSSGVSEVICVDRDIKVAWKQPRSSSDSIASGNGPWDAAIESGTTYKAALYWGTTPGTLGSVLCPALALAEPPKTVDIDGLLHDDLTFRPYPYTSDGASTNAGNSVLRIGGA